MKQNEKILLSLFALTFIIQFFFVHLFFMLVTLLLCVSYLIGGYWLFNSGDKKEVFLPVTAGIVFSASIIFLPALIGINYEYFYYYLPIPNALLCLALGIELYRKRKSDTSSADNKYIFIRSFIILLVTSFFIYTPLSFKPYRMLLYALNHDRADLQSNLLVIDFMSECDKAMERGDCNEAIQYAEKANIAGLIWLSVDYKKELYMSTVWTIMDYLNGNSTELSGYAKSLLNSFSKTDRLSEICGTYQYLYSAYKCRADTEYKQEQFQSALRDYQAADSCLAICTPDFPYWKEEKTWSMNHLALCYYQLKDYALADSFYIKAIYQYKSVKDTSDEGLARLYSNLALSYSDQEWYTEANVLYKAASNMLWKDTIDVDNRADLVSAYDALAKNYLKTDSLNQALFYIKKAVHFANDPASVDYCHAMLYYGICSYRLNAYKEADSIAKKALACYETDSKKRTVAECNFLLSNISIALAKYDDAKKYIEISMNIAQRNTGTDHYKYANYLAVHADINKLMGNYTTAEAEYYKVIETYRKEFGDRDEHLPSLLSALADLDIVLSDVHSAKQHIDLALSIASDEVELTSPRATDLLNEAAYVNYCSGRHKPADTLYRKVLDINEKHGLSTSASTATALNGLGLLAVSEKRYAKADSFYLKSLVLHQQIFSDKHPYTATVYLNIGCLYIQQGKLKEAEAAINKSLQINTLFFKSSHDVFADISVAMGDLEAEKKELMRSKEYYKKALDIYTAVFQSGHWKITETRAKYLR